MQKRPHSREAAHQVLLPLGRSIMGRTRFGRRTLFRHLCWSAAGLALEAPPAFAARGKTELTPEQALGLLKEGNTHFVSDLPQGEVVNRARRLEIARSQAPFAVLVGCSDSR